MAGILIFGLNGAGKSTLGKALARAMHGHFIDHEDLVFPKTDPLDPYAAPRSRDEVEQLLLREMEAHPNFIFASVKGNYSKRILARFQYAVLIDVPKEIRLQRVKQRSFETFGQRMQPGGDLYEQEERFFAMVESRENSTIDGLAQAPSCPILWIDGTKPVEESIASILEWIRS